MEGLEGRGRGCCRCPGERERRLTEKGRQGWRLLIIGQGLPHMEQEDGHGSTQPGVEEPRDGEQVPAPNPASEPRFSQ